MLSTKQVKNFLRISHPENFFGWGSYLKCSCYHRFIILEISSRCLHALSFLIYHCFDFPQCSVLGFWLNGLCDHNFFYFPDSLHCLTTVLTFLTHCITWRQLDCTAINVLVIHCYYWHHFQINDVQKVINWGNIYWIL